MVDKPGVEAVVRDIKRRTRSEYSRVQTTCIV